MVSNPAVFGTTAFVASAGALTLFYVAWSRRWMRRFLEQDLFHAATITSIEAIQELERSIGGELPGLLCDAYLSGSIARVGLPARLNHESMEYVITNFFAADAQSNRRFVQSIQVAENAFVFASDDFGNYYFVVANDESVFYWNHDGGNVTKEFGSVQELWELLPGLERLSEPLGP